MLEARANDGRFGPSQWVPNTAAGHWWPLSNAAGLDPRPDPLGGRGDAVPHRRAPRSSVPRRRSRSTAPQYAAEFNEVKSLGRATGSTRTDDQTYIAKWWQSAPTLSWNEVARQLIARNNLDAADSARLLALQNLTRSGCGDQLLERQVPLRLLAAVERDSPGGRGRQPRDDRRRGLDGAHHRAVSGVALGAQLPRRRTRRHPADVLRRRARGGFQITSVVRAPVAAEPKVRTFDTFSQPLAELIDARIWAGLHYRSADVAGQALGGNVARYGVANYFQPVGH